MNIILIESVFLLLVIALAVCIMAGGKQADKHKHQSRIHEQ